MTDTPPSSSEPLITVRTLLHTSGPWMVEPISDGLTYQVTTSEDEGFTVICETPWGDDADEANANVLAAGPEMLDALRLLHANARPQNWDDDEDPEQLAAWRALDAAIAKAEGRS